MADMSFYEQPESVLPEFFLGPVVQSIFDLTKLLVEDSLILLHSERPKLHEIDPIALKMAKTLWSFGHSECNRVKFYSSQNQLGCIFC